MPPPKAQAVKIPPLDIRTMEVKLVGDSPVIFHRWSDKARKEMLGKQMKEAKQAKQAKDPWMDFCESLYWVSDRPPHPTQEDVEKATFGAPSVWFKSAAVDACSHVDGVTKVQARGAFHLNGEFVQMHGDGPYMREDMVRIAMGTADIRYRGEFRNWHVVVSVRYNAAVLSAEQIVNLLNVAGFATGCGEYRPSRDGSFGMFHVATQEDCDAPLPLEARNEGHQPRRAVGR